MISISTIEYDLEGSVALESYQDFRDNAARVNRQKTLDGGVYINHSGYSEGDRTFTISEEVTEDQAAAIWYLFKNYTFLHIATTEGFFKGVIESLRVDNGDMVCNIYIKSREA